jgi:hypothetical protein
LDQTTSCRYLKQKLKIGEYSLKSAREWAKADSAGVADSLQIIMPDKRDIERKLPDSVKKSITKKKAFENTLTDSLMSIDASYTPEGDTSPRFYIITGSFANHANALKESGKYSGQGFKPTILPATDNDATGLELVSVRTFTEYNEAQDFLKGFKGSYNPGAWIYQGK